MKKLFRALKKALPITLGLLFGILVKDAWAEPMSAGMGILLGSLGSAAITTGGGLLGGLLGGGEQFTGFDPGYIELPQYSFSEPRLQLTSDFVSEQLANLQAGKFPKYFERALPTLREGLARPTREAFFGRPGERTGTIQAAQEAGAAAGLGPRQSVANVNKQLVEFANKERAIDEYLTKLGVDIATQGALAFPQISSAIPRGPEVYAWGPAGAGGVGNQYTGGGFNLGQQIGGALPQILGTEGLQQFGQGIGSFFGGIGNMLGFGNAPGMSSVALDPNIPFNQIQTTAGTGYRNFGNIPISSGGNIIGYSSL